jgi:LPXTG-site transpeptidase (sortase) family protein
VTRGRRRELRRQRLRRRRRARLRAAVAPLSLLAGISLLLAGVAIAAPTDPAGVEAIPLAGPSTMAALAAGYDPATVHDAPTTGDARTHDDTPTSEASPPSAPVAVAIARIQVQAELIELDLDDDGRLEVPADPDVAGWYLRGPRPGEAGPAVIAGHVDSRRGPAVFHRLPELAPGDEVVVHLADGEEVRFEVQRLERWPKDAFPTDAVYREAEGAELRLITCGGVFDQRTRRYEDNVIVFASAP